MKNNPNLLTGTHYKFYRKVLSAFRRGGSHFYLFGGIKFDGRIARVFVREWFGGFPKHGKKGSNPFDVTMRWNSKTTVKTILKNLIDGGYGTRKFESDDS